MKWGRCMLSNFGRQLVLHQNGHCPVEPNEAECAILLRCPNWVSSTPKGLARKILRLQGKEYNDEEYHRGKLIKIERR